jgi:hypothetical protein
MFVETLPVSRLAVARQIDASLQALIRITGDHFSGRCAFVKVAFGTALISLIVAFPHYHNLGKLLNHEATYALVFKIHHPLSPLPAGFKDQNLYGGVGSHNDKLDLRLTLPILGSLSHTGAWTVLVWNHISAFGAFYLLAYLANKALEDKVGSALFVFGIGPTFLGASFFNDIRFGDGVAFLLLLLSISFRNPLLSFCSFFAAAFCDERSVAVAPLLFLYLRVSLPKETDKSARRKQYIAIAAGATAWIILRSWLSFTFHLTTGTSLIATHDILSKNLTNLPVWFFRAFKACWVLPLFSILTLVSFRRWLALSALLAAFTSAIAPAFAVYDSVRSACYSFPVLLISLHFFQGDKDASRKYLAAILVVNLLVISPNHSILRIINWLS